MGTAPPAGGDAKPRGRGGMGAQLRDVRWGMIFSMGWKLLSFFKVLVVGYGILMLLQNCVSLGTSQLVGEVTNAIKRVSQQNTQTTVQTSADNSTATPQQPAANPNSPTGPNATQGPQEKAERRWLPEDPLALVILWSIVTLVALGIRLPMKAVQTKLDLGISNKLRSQLFGRLLRQSPEFYHKHETGELNAVVNQFAVEASLTLRQVSLDVILAIVTLGITVGLLIYNFDMNRNAQHGPAETAATSATTTAAAGPATGATPGTTAATPTPASGLNLFGMNIPAWPIPIVITLFAFISPWMTGKMANKVRDVSRNLQEKMVALNSLVTGAMQSPEEIQAMQAERLFTNKHDKQLDSLLHSRLKNQVTMEYMGLVSGLPSWVVEVAMLVLAVLVAYQSKDPSAAGKVIAISLLTPQLMTPIQGLSAYILMAGNAWPAIETVNDMMESKARREEKAGTLVVKQVEPTLAAKNVTFSYTPGGRKIFDDISFEIPTGKITGFVARMGQGKTTFFKLALRFYDPQQGQVVLGGRPVTEYASDNLYTHIAMMSQFPAFFYDTLRANMQMAKQDATDEEIRALCEKTGVWKILEASAAGPGNPLDQEFAGARRLSGGQKKLLALTRCLLRNPSVLFLDEPTVGMDNKEKFSMLEIIKQALKGHTVMVVDHDLRWLMPFCNYFIVLDNGRISEQGTAEELLARRGLFYELYHAEEAKPEGAGPAGGAGPGPGGGAGPQMAQMAGRRPPGA